MVATYEFIDEIKASGERMHEMMVNAARQVREYRDKAKRLEREIATLSPQDPKREQLMKHLDLVRFLTQTAQGDMVLGRSVLDTDKVLLEHLEGEG